MNERMTPEEILADMEAFDKEVVPEKVHPAFGKDLPARSPTSSTEQVQEGEASAGEVSSDAGETVPDAEPKPVEATEENVTPKATVERERDPVTGKFVGKEPVPGELEPVPEASVAELETEKSVEGQKPDPEVKNQKAQKEQERQKSLLANFEEEKTRERATIAAEKAEIARERERLRLEELEKRQSVGARPKDEYGNEIYSSAELRKAALQYRDLAFKGETGPNGEDYADWSRRAEQAATQAVQRETKEAQELFERRQTQLALETMTQNAELADANSPLAQELQYVFNQELQLSQENKRGSIFKMIPDGFKMAVEVAKLRTQANEAGSWKAKYETEHAEVERLNGLNRVASSSPTKPHVSKTPDQMTADEGLAEMDKVAIKQGAKLFL